MMTCYYCGKQITIEQVELWRMGFPAHKIGVSHENCARGAENRKSKINNIMVFLYLAIFAASILVANIIDFVSGDI